MINKEAENQYLCCTKSFLCFIPRGFAFFHCVLLQCILSTEECRTSPHNKQVVNFCNFSIKIGKLFYLLGVMYPCMNIKMIWSIVAQCPDMCCRSIMLIEETLSSKQKAKPRKPVWVPEFKPKYCICCLSTRLLAQCNALSGSKSRFYRCHCAGLGPTLPFLLHCSSSCSSMSGWSS